MMNSEPTRSLEQNRRILEDWISTWLHPVNNALYCARPAEAGALIEQARGALETADLPVDVREALKYAVRATASAVYWYPPATSWTRASYEEELPFYLARAQSELAEAERVRRLIIIEFHADVDGYDELTHDRLVWQLDCLPIWCDDPVIWHYVAGWAFAHDDLGLMERAFESHLINPSIYMGHARWQRVNLMYQLMEGKATRRDVEETIRILAVLPQVVEFRQRIWPACIRAGLVDAELEAMLAQKAAEIEREKPAPPSQPKTISLRQMV